MFQSESTDVLGNNVLKWQSLGSCLGMYPVDCTDLIRRFSGHKTPIISIEVYFFYSES